MKTFREFVAEAKGPRIRIVKARIRSVGGKISVQRRKRVSNVKGYSLKGSTLKRITATERMHRKAGQRRGKIKRRAKMSRIRLRYKRSMARRKAMGLK